MIYGYDVGTLNEYGLKQMKEVSIAAAPDALRELAAFLLQTADELPKAGASHWHRHVPASLHDKLGCDVIVLDSE